MKNIIIILLLNSVHLIYAQDSTLKTAIQNLNNDNRSFLKIVEIEKLLSKSTDDKLKVEALYTIGKVFLRLEKYDKAYASYAKALSIATHLKSGPQIGLLKEALGNLQFKLGNFDKSRALYLESLLHFNTNTEDINQIAKIKGNLALIDIKKGNTQKAIHSLTELSNIKNLDSVSKAIALLSIGNIYLENLSNSKTAIQYYKKSIILINRKKESNLICSIYQNIAESYFEVHQYNEALSYNKISETFLENNNELSATLHLFYAKIYEAQANPRLALKNYKRYQDYQNLVNESKNLIKIENIEVSNQLKKIEINNKLKEQKIQILKTEKSLAVTKNYLLILLIIVICLIIYIVLKKQKIKIYKLYSRVIQSQNKLKFTENKTEKIMLNIHQNNDFINHFTNKLKEVLHDIDDDKTRQNLNSLLFELQNSKINKIKSDELYKDIASTFLYNLQKEYPILSEDERKICAAIFLNYKNKEIAASLNLSLRSIENGRYRIRKKMNLETSTSLYQQLQSLQ
ncbi:tetratricopeptide repeat protein [Flavobacterium sp.]